MKDFKERRLGCGILGLLAWGTSKTVEFRRRDLKRGFANSVLLGALAVLSCC